MVDQRLLGAMFGPHWNIQDLFSDGQKKKQDWASFMVPRRFADSQLAEGQVAHHRKVFPAVLA